MKLATQLWREATLEITTIELTFEFSDIGETQGENRQVAFFIVGIVEGQGIGSKEQSQSVVVVAVVVVIVSVVVIDA